MLKHYSDDDLLTMFEAFAVKGKARDVVMTTLESVLVVSWKDKKMSTFDVFTQLKLDQKVDDLLRDKLFSESKFAIWFQYAAEGGTLPKSATMIMLKHYSDDDLLTMFEAFAVKGKARDVVMTTLESVLVVSWKDKKMSTFDVFTQLKLDQKVDDLLRDKLFSESKFAIWFHYAAEGEILPESATQIMLKHYSDEDLLKMFEAFAVKGKTRKAVWFPLIASWKDKNYTAIQVFKLMKLDQEMDNPPYDKLLRLWVDYVGLSSTTPLLAMKVVILGYFKNHETVEMISEGLERLGLAKKNVPKVPEVSEVPK
ncbi:hypothetical protein DD238_005716 [Peronospora effusa]|uniref:RXLR phytopathogen effector protein WY-domain domain-containing protein n=1 Tax=Peronospora effusa TaxID=542832 RepID=A0A3M6VC34_9STRA|nr:hypothetical protein DD238_005716 [Peronospora effusa]